jgi:hypothetical protein
MKNIKYTLLVIIAILPIFVCAMEQSLPEETWQKQICPYLELPSIVALQSTCSLFRNKLGFKLVISPEYARQLSYNSYVFTEFLYVVANKDDQSDEKLFTLLWENQLEESKEGLIPRNKLPDTIKPFECFNIEKFKSLSQNNQTIILSDLSDRCFHCIKENDIKAIKVFLLSPLKDDLDRVNKKEESLLEKSCHCSDSTILQLLLDNGVSLMHPHKKHYNIFYYLCATPGTHPYDKLAVIIKHYVNNDLDIIKNMINQKDEYCIYTPLYGLIFQFSCCHARLKGRPKIDDVLKIIGMFKKHGLDSTIKIGYEEKESVFEMLERLKPCILCVQTYCCTKENIEKIKQELEK